MCIHCESHYGHNQKNTYNRVLKITPMFKNQTKDQTPTPPRDCRDHQVAGFAPTGFGIQPRMHHLGG